MPAWMGRLSSGVGPRHSVTIRKASLLAGWRRFVVADLELKFNFLVVKRKSCRHRFCSAELQFPGPSLGSTHTVQ